MGGNFLINLEETEDFEEVLLDISEVDAVLCE